MPTPQQAAQWVIEAHLEHMTGQISDDEHSELIGHLAAVYDAMDAAALKKALGAMTDIAEDFASQLVAGTTDVDRALNLVWNGNGRLHVTEPRPANPSTIGAVPAMRLAEKIAR